MTRSPLSLPSISLPSRMEAVTRRRDGVVQKESEGIHKQCANNDGNATPRRHFSSLIFTRRSIDNNHVAGTTTNRLAGTAAV